MTKHKKGSGWNFMHRYILIFLSLIFIACESNEVSIPDDVIDREEMVLILADIHIAEATSNYKLLNDSVKTNINIYYSDIFKKHNITSEQYKTSYDFYLEHPQLFNRMYDEVINELSRRQTEILTQ